MRGVNDEATSQTAEAQDVREPVQGEKMDDDLRAELTRELEDWTPEEEGYGYGV